MATTEQIAQLKALLGPAGFGVNDTDLGVLIDSANGDLNKVAADRWGTYASSTANLVNVSESGSSRNMSEVHKNALNMAAYFRKLSESANPTPEPVSDRPRTRPIVRA